MTKPTSDEFLNAFLDGELAAAERESALQQLEADDDFRRSACETRTLKEMVRGAYAELPVNPGRRNGGWLPRSARQALAAGLLLFFGAGLGWFSHGRMEAQAPLAHLAGLPAGYQAIALAGKVDPRKIVLHLDSSEVDRLAAALDLADALLASHGSTGRVEIVTHSHGLALLQAASPYRARIARLAQRHANLKFIACAQSLARMHGGAGKQALLPEAEMVPTGIGEILGRMQEGWVYVKV
jgi:hypothetical protein